jgi:SprB repeat/CHU_C Type IX secretion signal domain
LSDQINITHMRKHITIYLILALSLSMAAQATNDECTTPILIQDVKAFCSPTAAFNNNDATPSSYAAASCFTPSSSAGADVWYSFVATATDITITVRGATASAAGGTLQDPQVALYFGSCGGIINELQCGAGVGNDNVVEIYEGGLFVGATYLIRIQGQSNKKGTFQLCINNYNPPVEPTSDCPTASILCDKSSFVVQSVTGAGSNNQEMEDATCFFNGSPGLKESNSTWFTWTCSESGSLTFVLTPLNAPDDLDFVLYRLPQGLGKCQGKEIVRCMASGLSQGQNFPSPCLGPTGLTEGDPDVSEDAGCSEAGDNAWLSAFNMVAGESYALVVNNFSETGNGFSVDFGGTGKFLGPEADFYTIPDAICLDTAVLIVDASTFQLGAITAWKWSFGADAMPQTATGPGPHTVSFGSPGTRPIVLTLETDLGCRITDIESVLVYPDVAVDTLIASPDCNGTANGAVEIKNITSGTPPFQFSWNGGPFGSDSTLQNIGPGTYTLRIVDKNNCQTDLSIKVDERILTADANPSSPLCFGDNNGAIALTVTNGKAPVLFNWGTGFVPQNTQGNLVAGTYTIQAIDDALCKGTFTVTIADNPPMALSLDTTGITCFGANDGMAAALASGGVGNYLYEWSDGQIVQNAMGFEPGTYAVTVSDGNDCSITATATYENPERILLSVVNTEDLRCNGLPSGSIEVSAMGGRPPYTYSADGTNFVPTPILGGLAAGDYQVIVRDVAGCLDSVAASLLQPPPVTVTAFPQDTTLDLGQSVQIDAFTTPTGRPVTPLWTPPLGVSDINILEPEIQATETIAYIIQVTDEDGCIGTDTVRITVNKKRPMYFPNIFGPDKPFPNNAFTGYGGRGAASIVLLNVYDRWGSLIFENKNFDHSDGNLGWDGSYKGKPVDGVFAWYAIVKFIDGVEIPFEGDVTVIR